MSAREDDAGELRRRAEQRLAELEARDGRGSRADTKRLLHELRVHQIELEMQNEELQASRLETEKLLERYTELFDFAPIGFFHVGHDGTLRASNFAGARLLGVPRGVLIGRDFASFVAERDRRGFVTGFLASVLTRGDEQDGVSATAEVTLLPGGAREIRARVTGARLAGAAPSALLAVEDVTYREAAEEALREEARRKDEFLAALSHELRNPLAPIRNALSILALLPPGSEKAPGALAILDRQVSHLTRVVDDLLDVTRLARGKIRLQRERLELGDLVRRTVEDHRAGLEAKGIQVRCDTSAGPAWVDADGTRIAQVLGNLLGNALKFTDSEGHVEVVLSHDDARAALRVRDTGIGIAADLAAHLFEPFSQGPRTLDRSPGGLGLGLATVKGLIELHGGTVEVASDGPGRGTEFTVRLPLVPQPESHASGGEPARLARPLRVLVVEDNPDAAETLRDLLELHGHAVRVAADGPGGVLSARSFRPDVVFCDIGLPGMSGYDVARALRSEDSTKGAWLVALSGYALSEDALQATGAGFDHHVTKPAPPEVIERLLSAFARRSAR